MRIIYILLIAFFMQASFAVGNIHRHGEDSYPLADALKTGVDTDGKPLFLCVARLFNSTQPGKTWSGYGHCNVPYGGKEYVIDQFEIPSKDMFRRVYWSNNPGEALTIGRDTNGNPLFLCQTYFKGSRQPGKTWPGYNHCNISYAGQEIITNNYQILVEAGRGSLHHGHNGQYHRHNEQSNSQYHGHPSQTNQQCLQGPFNQACGYNCIRSINNVACAASPDQQCVSDNFGHIACGYGCVRTPFKVACASHRGERCVIDRFNTIHCTNH
ncbi:Protein of uncharacterised function (DUF3421) [Legionella lansingensis]|uniref:DUF3421 domain-containing protein n=1 Tax=Legionella lansingensis TaxID=45067 RepID=A0A0W0VMI2_9GAMM|nr:DUF3421 domain-containing protein [Legionella lansingensis]KTD21014.1 hypothetical protein Llan_1744 [Legionella lansingensis]SNV45003.1 Protein of uncharacterised function (DUF3421) [Legionella lansingensis]